MLCKFYESYQRVLSNRLSLFTQVESINLAFNIIINMLYQLKEKLRIYSNNFVYPTIISLLVFLGWLIPFFEYVSCIFISAFCLLPFFTKKGSTYLPLIIFPMFMINSRQYRFLDLNLAVTIIYAFVIVSIVYFLFKTKKRFVLGKLFFPLIIFSVFLTISMIISFLTFTTNQYKSIFHILGFYFLIFGYLLINTLMKGERNVNELLKFASYLAVLISVELYIFYMSNPLAIGESGEVFIIEVGGYTTPESLTSICVLLIPIIGMSIYYGKWYYSFIGLMLVADVILLMTNIGIFVLIIGAIPVIYLSFRSYRRAAPYIYISISTIAIVFLVTIISLNSDILRKIVYSLTYLNLNDNVNTYKINQASNLFINNPILGNSIITVYDLYPVSFFNNTYLDIAVAGGVFGIVSFACFEIVNYYLVFKSQLKSKWLLLTMLILLDFLSLGTNTYFDLRFLMCFLIIMSSFENSVRRDDIVVNRNFYINENLTMKKWSSRY